jgi:hypothetical protein
MEHDAVLAGAPIFSSSFYRCDDGFRRNQPSLLTIIFEIRIDTGSLIKKFFVCYVEGYFV